MSEILAKRAAHSKTYDLGGGKFAIDASIGKVHYKDSQGNWQDVNTQIVGGIMNQADYTFRLLQNTFNAGQIVEFAVGTDYIRLQPMALEWTNDLNQIQQVSMPQAVAGAVTNTPVQRLPNVDSQQGSVKWLNAYGTGRDFEWVLGATSATKILTIPSLVNLPPPTPTIKAGGNPTLRLNMIFADSNMDIYVDGVRWTKQANSRVQTFGRIEFKRNGQTLWEFAPLYYWDSMGNRGESIKTLRRAGNNLYIEIRVPYSWLQAAVDPVFIDATLDLQVNLGTDDGEERESPSTMDITNANARCASSVNNWSRYWFAHIWTLGTTIALGSTINVAYIEVRYNNSGNNDANFDMHFEKAAAPATLTTDANNIQSRTRTTASVAWVQDNVAVSAGWITSASLVVPLQEVVDAYAITKVGLIFKPKTDLERRLDWSAYETTGNVSGGKIHIEYTEGGQALTITPLDTVTITEAISRGFGAIRTETFTLTDSSGKSFGLTATDSMLLAEVLASVLVSRIFGVHPHADIFIPKKLLDDLDFDLVEDRFHFKLVKRGT